MIAPIICMFPSIFNYGRGFGHILETFSNIFNLLSIILSIHLLGFLSHLHRRLLALNKMTVSVNESEKDVTIFSDTRTCTHTCCCKYVCCMSPKMEETYTRKRKNKISLKSLLLWNVTQFLFIKHTVFKKYV